AGLDRGLAGARVNANDLPNEVSRVECYALAGGLATPRVTAEFVSISPRQSGFDRRRCSMLGWYNRVGIHCKGVEKTWFQAFGPENLPQFLYGCKRCI
ncbi:MAG: hypothetical protein JWO52_4257, partial [Gammaproteobacteria bacterium]|nr:hypothetical protein [Gammaproteobacteria bacterium]